MKRENSGNRPSKPRTKTSDSKRTSISRVSKSSFSRSKPSESGSSSFSKGKYSEGKSTESKNRTSRTSDKPFERKSRSGPSSYTSKSRGFGVKNTEEKPFERKARSTGSSLNDGTRPYSKRVAGNSFEKRPRTSDSPKVRKDSFRKREDGKDFASPNRRRESNFENKGGRRPFTEKGESPKKAYGSSETYKDRKGMKSFKELDNSNEGETSRFRKKVDYAPIEAGKGRFSKKSELKGFKPRSSKSDSDENFRFKKPGAKGKQIDLGYKEEFVSKSKSQSKERITEDALNVGDAIRLNRFISNAGVCSRREADELIGAGLVSINGAVVTELGSKVKAGDVVRFNGEKLTVEAKVYILLNKPKDAITTSDDPDGRNTVMDIFDGKMRERIFPVGRLDRNTTGVLLLTNDGELANRLMHPKYEVKKVYKATLDKNLKPADLWTLSNGVELEDGYIKPDALAQSDAKNKNVVGVEIHSGKNRIIHRMFEHLGYSVEKLDRVLYAGLEKGILKRGAYRELNEKELKQLKRSIQMK